MLEMKGRACVMKPFTATALALSRGEARASQIMTHWAQVFESSFLSLIAQLDISGQNWLKYIGLFNPYVIIE